MYFHFKIIFHEIKLTFVWIINLILNCHSFEFILNWNINVIFRIFVSNYQYQRTDVIAYNLIIKPIKLFQCRTKFSSEHTETTALSIVICIDSSEDWEFHVWHHVFIYLINIRWLNWNIFENKYQADVRYEEHLHAIIYIGFIWNLTTLNG